MNALMKSPPAAISPNAGEILGHLNFLRKHALTLKAHYPDVPGDTVLGVMFIPTEGKGPTGGVSFPLAQPIMETSTAFQSLLAKARNAYWSVFIRACTGPAGKCASHWEATDAHMLLGVVIDRDGGHKAKYGKPHPLVPSCSVQTSTGSAHDWYLLDSAITEEQFMRIAASVKALDADAPPSVQHLYRIIGTVNWPSPSKAKKGRTPSGVKLLSSGVRYSAAALVEAADTILAQPISQRAAAKVRDPRGGGKRAPVDRTKLLDALRWIPADGYHDWIHVGMALKFEFGPEGLPIWDAWSKQAHNYPGLSALEDKWGSFHEKTDKPITARTIFKMARDHGWVDHKAAADDFADADGDGGSTGRKTVNLAGIVALLKTDKRFDGLVGFNQFTGRDDVLRHLPTTVAGAGQPNAPFTPRPITDKDQLHMRLVIQQTAGYGKASREDVCGALELIAGQNHHHPVQDYLTSRRWDGVLRLSTFLTDIGGQTMIEPDSPASLAYVAAVGRSVLISAVARAMTPGCKVDTMLVMEGTQGAGKSSFIAELVPDPDWVSDNLPKDLASKDAEHHLMGKWFVELSELSALRKSDAETVKSFVTKQVEKFRPVFCRNEITWPRTCIFVGSTNATDYLQDPTGNRRFLPVRFVKTIPPGTAACIRDQLWAEALIAWRAGEPWWLEGDVLETARAEQAARLAGDPWDDRLPGVLDAMRQGCIIPTVTNILEKLGIDKSAQHNGHAVRVTNMLKRLGYESDQRRIGASRPRIWWHTDHGDEPLAEWEAAALAASAAAATRVPKDWGD